MKKSLTIVASIIIAGIGAFFLFNAIIKTGVPALDHSFTRGFIDTRAETSEEGFYLFESGTGQFTMHYPDRFEVTSDLYSITENRFESFAFKQILDSDTENLVSTFNLMFRDGLDKSRRSTQLEMLLRDFSYEGQYETYETENTIFYHGESIGEFSETERETIFHSPSAGTTNRYFAFVEDKHSDKFIRITLRLNCLNSLEKHCSINETENAEMFLYIIESIQFKE